MNLNEQQHDFLVELLQGFIDTPHISQTYRAIAQGIINKLKEE